FPSEGNLARGSSDGAVRLWDTGTRRQIGGPLTGHKGSVSSVAFSSDGTLASGSSDDSVRLWDTGTRRQIGGPLTGHEGPVTSVAFSSDGTLASGDRSLTGTVRLWDVTYVNDAASYLCDEVGLLPIPWAEYVPPGPSHREICP
ncbi:WD40 repeat domain-containing protein, partial [Streptomyces sp. NPDC059096]|uniref:WD40 repeat domain-containing protein n=1 Tax=Streptomyces sp. NPDC059096 TaxID=3346727 RepID=UPI0036A58539